jgi:molybdenum cofactor cytidylyltransferase
VRVSARALIDAGAQEVVLVPGHRRLEVASAVADLPLSLQHNPRYAEGQMTSVAAGLAALTRPCLAVMVCLADMALLRADDYRALAQAFATLPRDAILVPHHQGQRGNPVVFAASRVPEVLGGQINPGCRRLIENHPDDVVRWEAGHDRCIVDMDTPDDYARMRARLSSRMLAQQVT